jgi:hypothetical protein
VSGGFGVRGYADAKPEDDTTRHVAAGFIVDSDDDAALEAEASEYVIVEPQGLEDIHQTAAAEGWQPATLGARHAPTTAASAEALSGGAVGTRGFDNLRALLATAAAGKAFVDGQGVPTAGAVVPAEFYRPQTNRKETHVGLPRLAYLGLAAGASPAEVTQLLVKGARRMTAIRWSELLTGLVRPAPIFDFGSDRRVPEVFQF